MGRAIIFCRQREVFAYFFCAFDRLWRRMGVVAIGTWPHIASACTRTWKRQLINRGHCHLGVNYDNIKAMNVLQAVNQTLILLRWRDFYIKNWRCEHSNHCCDFIVENQCVFYATISRLYVKTTAGEQYSYRYCSWLRSKSHAKVRSDLHTATQHNV